MSNLTLTPEDVLVRIIETDVPSRECFTRISDLMAYFGATRRRISQCIHILEAQGLIQVTEMSWYDSEKKHPGYHRGYTPTGKAKEHPIYEEAHKKRLLFYAKEIEARRESGIIITQEKEPLRTDVTIDEVLDLIIQVDVECSAHTKITSVPYMAHSLHTSKHRIRKHIAKLKEEGLVQSDMESCYSDYHEHHFIMRGYVLTDKARHLQKWHEANIKELRTMAECFYGLDMDGAIEAAEEAAERDSNHE